MRQGFIYSRWLLTLTFCCLMGLLAVGMMTVHSKRTLRSLAVNIDSKEAQLQELGRRQDILDTDLASALNPSYLKQLVEISGLRLGSPREDRIIVVRGFEKAPEESAKDETADPAPQFQTRFQLANNERSEID
jgi:hypothetical protein